VAKTEANIQIKNTFHKGNIKSNGKEWIEAIQVPQANRGFLIYLLVIFLSNHLKNGSNIIPSPKAK
jgi:hypothetical protein